MPQELPHIGGPKGARFLPPTIDSASRAAVVVMVVAVPSSLTKKS